MARTRRIKSEAVGTAYYHLMSRTNDKRFLFDRGRIKTQLVDALKRAAAFSGVEIDAYVAMDNHCAGEPVPIAASSCASCGGNWLRDARLEAREGGRGMSKTRKPLSKGPFAGSVPVGSTSGAAFASSCAAVRWCPSPTTRRTASPPL